MVEVEAVLQVAQVLRGEVVEVLVPRNLEAEEVAAEDQVELIFPSAVQADPVVVLAVVAVQEVLQILVVPAVQELEVNLVLMAWYLMITDHTALTCSVRLACPSNLRSVDPWFQICLREMQYLNLQFSKTFLHFQQLIWLL